MFVANAHHNQAEPEYFLETSATVISGPRLWA